MRDCLIVVGMHRSGTSALTGALHRLGVAVGSDVAQTASDNVPGYYEHGGVLRLHEDLFAASGTTWDDIAPRPWPQDGRSPAVEGFKSALAELLDAEFADTPLWAVKDPRLCHTLELWLPVLAQLEIRPHVLLAHRPAHEVATSLARRNGFSLEKSALLWLDHVLTSERASRGCSRSFVAFSDLLDDPVGTLDRLGRQLDVVWPEAPADCATELASFLDPSLRHHRTLPMQLVSHGGELIEKLETALAAAAEDPSATASFERVANRLQEVRPAIDPLVLEHLHQFSRRETAASLWTVKEGLEGELGRASQRLGSGVANLERAIEDLRTMLDSLASGLDASNRLAEERSSTFETALRHLREIAGGPSVFERRATIESSLQHQEEALAALDATAKHQESQLADLRARLDRIQNELQLEVRLAATQDALDYLGRRVDELGRQSDEAWPRRFLRRLAFWRERPQATL